MTHNSSRADRSESTQHKKTGRSGSFNQQRKFSGTPPPLNYSNRGVEKYDGNAPGVQSRPRSPDVNTGFSNSYTSQAVQNDAHKQQPANTPGDASRSFPLQFGSISPGFMNGVQIPAQTSSAPQNFDERKKDQARHQSLRTAVPAKPLSSIPKQLSTKKAGTFDQSNVGESQPVSMSRRDTQVSAAPPMSQTQIPSVSSVPGMPMQLPFHQPQVTVQFGGPNPQIQSQSLSGTSLQSPMSMPLPLPLGNPPMQQPMFVSGLPPHPMQSQGMIHQGQALNFPSHMGPQLPPQWGNLGMNMVPQFPQQQAVKYGGSRKTVKITHPETREELRLDDSPGLMSHSNVQPQSHSQHIPSFPPNHLMNFYNATSFYFPAASSVPPNSAQVPPTPNNFYNATSDTNVHKSVVLGGKKKKKEKLYKKAEAAGSSDMYMAYKGHEEKKEISSSSFNLISPSPAITNEKILSDTIVQKSVVLEGKKKKKKKELYKKAEASGTSYDMYMAYKGPEKKKETATLAVDLENISSSSIKQTSVDVPHQNALLTVKPAQSRVVPDDWENAAEIPTPQLETSNNEIQSYDRDCDGLIIKRYSRDFLLKLAKQCTDLPEGFEVTYVHFSHEPRPRRNKPRR